MSTRIGDKVVAITQPYHNGWTVDRWDRTLRFSGSVIPGTVLYGTFHSSAFAETASEALRIADAIMAENLPQ